MKKFILGIGCIALTISLNAQNAKRVSAYNYLKYGELDKAKTAIDEASEHADTKEEAKTWVYKGQVYQAIFDTKEEKYKGIATNPLEEAVKSYFKALQLDQKGNYKQEIVMGMMRIAAQLQNQGVAEYNANQFDKAMGSFAGSFEISNKMFQKVDTMCLYNAAISADKSNNYPMAKTFYKQLVGYKYGGAKTYRYLADVCKKDKDDAGYIQAIKDGRVAYPNDKDLIIDELNYYIENGKTAEAVANLNLAIEKEPNNAILHFNLGTLYDNMANPKNGAEPKEAERKDMMIKAENSYKKAIELNPNYFDALFNIGAMYFNEGVKMNDKANAITDTKKYNAEMVNVDNKFKQAIPYFEKAKQLGTDDKASYKAVLNSLKQLYARTGENDKYKAIQEELKK